MKLSQWVKTLWGSNLRKSQQRTHSRRRSMLSLEALEDRWVPSLVTNTNDSGPGSLRYAIGFSTPAGGTVTFQTGLTGPIKLTSGALTITLNLTITGPGASSLAIDGNASSTVFSVINGVTANISGLTIQNGKGGGILNEGILTLQSDTVTKNTTEDYGGGISNGGTITINNCTITSNDSTGISGGGIDNDGTLTINNSTVASNSANRGGGISDRGEGNQFNSGFSLAPLTVTSTTIDSNTANSAGGGGGGIDVEEGGVAIITGSTISNNQAVGDSHAVNAGGILVGGGSLTLINSTVSGNQATSTIDATAFAAGGLAVSTPVFYAGGNASVTLTQDTFGNNTAASAADAKDLGVFQSSTGTASLTLGNTILGSTATTNPNVFNGGGTITSQGNNLSFDGTGAATATDLKGDPLLGPLTNNGGLTFTQALLANSPAIGKGSVALSVDQNGKALTTDQTGGPRIINGAVDIGAVEANAPSGGGNGVNGAVAFSAVASSFNETAGTATLTLTRTNGTMGAVSVQYVVSAATNLATKYQAVPNTDFTGTLAGIVNFNAGDAQKTITFTLTQDQLVEDNKSFLVNLGQPTGGAALGSVTTTTVTILDDNLPQVPNATPKLATLQLAGLGFGTSTEHYQQFIRTAYATYLQRVPSAAEMAYWVNLMQEYQANHATGLRQQDVEAGFLDSAEYLSRNGGTPNKTWIDSIYQNLLGRAPDPSGEAFWLSQLAAGVSPQTVAEGFTDSQERLSDRVTATYQTLLGRAPDANGLAYWINVFNTGGTTEDINSGFVGSVEYYNKQGGAAGNPAAWIREAYLDVLFRAAQVSEMTYWLNYLNQ